jgi:hypothetical protein
MTTYPRDTFLPGYENEVMESPLQMTLKLGSGSSDTTYATYVKHAQGGEY